jgi:hypothetical protein
MDHLCMTQIDTALAQQTPLAIVVFSLINHVTPTSSLFSIFAVEVVTGPSRGWPSGALR